MIIGIGSGKRLLKKGRIESSEQELKKKVKRQNGGRTDDIDGKSAWWGEGTFFP